jgi:cytochrome c oxidase assembly protein subunit 15
VQQVTSDPESPELRWLGFGFGALTSVTLGLIVLGALVRANGAGLACPDWPLCFGEIVPEFNLKVAFEWSHRVVAGSVSLVFLGLCVGSLRNPSARASIGRLLVVAAGLLALQVALGALTVWKLLASWSVSSHLLTGNAFAVCLLFASCALLELRTPPTPVTHARSTQLLLSATTILLVLQILLGGLVSSNYAGLACPEWPTCFEGAWFPSFSGAQGLHLLHRIFAYALLTALGVCAWHARGTPRLGALTGAALALGVVQVGIGVANVLLRIPTELTGLHSGLAAVLVLTVAAAMREIWRPT